MTAAPSAAEALIAMHHLGTPKKVYKPHTILSVIAGLCLMAFAFAWIMLALILTGSPLLPANQIPTLLLSPDPTLSTLLTILGIVFPLVGLIFVGVGLRIIITALLNRNVRAVLCKYGVVHLGRKGTDAFRWEQVAAVLDKVSVHTSTTDQSGNGTTTSTTISHTYTVACKDGRRFIFDRILGKVEQLGEEIQIAVAISQKSA